VYRELESLHVATQDYEAAVATYSDELRSLNDTLDSVRRGTTVNLLLQKDTGSAGSSGQAGHASVRPDTRYLGRLLASRDFQQTLHDHGELQSMLNDIDKGLHNIDKLAKVIEPDGDLGIPLTAFSASKPNVRESGAPAMDDGTGRAKGRARTSLRSDSEWEAEWEQREGQQAEDQSSGIPLLPEIELPEGSVQPLPESEFTGLPESEFTGLPEAPEPRALLQGGENIGLPVSQIAWLPETGRLQLPWNEQEYAYPDAVALAERRAGPDNKRKLMRLITPPSADAGFNTGAEPVGEALRELATALSSATDRMAQLSRASDAAPPGVDGLESRISALHARILRLRARINHAIALNESYIQSLALDELDRRQHQLQDLLEQASLELAKTYDQAADN
jgi:hypothetical protein